VKEYYYYYYYIVELEVSFEVSFGVLLKQGLPTASMKVSLSSKDNFIETRTKIIVGAMP
jgi:hypothetical protein